MVKDLRKQVIADGIEAGSLKVRKYFGKHGFYYLDDQASGKAPRTSIGTSARSTPSGRQSKQPKGEAPKRGLNQHTQEIIPCKSS
mgnify:CR=1 FL=1|jgi:hypothetical protein